MYKRQVYKEYNDGRVLVDWLYNRPRPDDDAIPDVLAAHMGLDLYSTIESPGDLMNTGGNFAGIVVAPLMPYLANHVGWVTALSTGTVMAFVGAALWLFIRADHPFKPCTP